MLPCLEGEGCDLLINRSGWTCTQPGGRIKTTTVRTQPRSLLAPGGQAAPGSGYPWGGGLHVGGDGESGSGLLGAERPPASRPPLPNPLTLWGRISLSLGSVRLSLWQMGPPEGVHPKGSSVSTQGGW